jgi:hypothetical protein
MLKVAYIISITTLLALMVYIAGPWFIWLLPIWILILVIICSISILLISIIVSLSCLLLIWPYRLFKKSVDKKIQIDIIHKKETT